jgi:Peptidase family M48
MIVVPVTHNLIHVATIDTARLPLRLLDEVAEERGAWRKPHGCFSVSHAISRQQEFLADALSARTVHPETTASALRRSKALAIPFNGYWKQELASALSAGCLPPITAGFERYLASEHIASAVNRFLDSAQERTETNPLDTHPPLHERIAALKLVSAAGPRPASDPPASTLLPNIETDAQELLEFHAGGMAFSRLRKVEWNDLGMVYAPQWRALTAKSSKFLEAYTTDTIPAGPEAFKKAGSQLMSGDAERRIARAQQTFGAAVAVALLDAGAVAESEPGQPFVFRKGAAAMKPFEVMAQLADGTRTVEEWQAQCRMMGIAGVPLCPAAVSSGPAGSRAPSLRSRGV